MDNKYLDITIKMRRSVYRDAEKRPSSEGLFILS